MIGQVQLGGVEGVLPMWGVSVCVLPNLCEREIPGCELTGIWLLRMVARPSVRPVKRCWRRVSFFGEEISSRLSNALSAHVRDISGWTDSPTHDLETQAPRCGPHHRLGSRQTHVEVSVHACMGGLRSPEARPVATGERFRVEASSIR